jgi:hypothetical protein
MESDMCDHCMDHADFIVWRKTEVSDAFYADMMTVVENAALEVYDWPGEYAQRFDGIDKGGNTFDVQPQLGGHTFDDLAVDPTNPNASDLFTIQLDLTTETIRPTESLFDL